jgi:hypothetical protein
VCSFDCGRKLIASASPKSRTLASADGTVNLLLICANHLRPVWTSVDGEVFTRIAACCGLSNAGVYMEVSKPFAVENHLIVLRLRGRRWTMLYKSLVIIRSPETDE